MWGLLSPADDLTQFRLRRRVQAAKRGFIVESSESIKTQFLASVSLALRIIQSGKRAFNDVETWKKLNRFTHIPFLSLYPSSQRT